jgi:hypothetical protein
MSYLLQILFILAPLTCWASEHTELEFLKKRQQGFEKWQAQERAFEARREAAAQVLKKKRLKHEQQLQQARDNYKRVPPVQTHLEEAYLAKMAQREAKREVQQIKYAKQRQVVDHYIEKHIVPMMKKEYDIQDGPVNDSQH